MRHVRPQWDLRLNTWNALGFSTDYIETETTSGAVVPGDIK